MLNPSNQPPLPLLPAHPFRLCPDFRERVWGISDLKGWFPEAPDQIIGEAWFTAASNRVPTGNTLEEILSRQPELLGTGGDPTRPGFCPLLVKLLFTSSRLSVQVHPKDDYAALHHQSLGKTEAWIVIDAKPGADVALGFKEELTPERFRDSAVSGEIEALLDWRAVEPGDVIFVPAGTVHAIGAGLTICEIQQNSDITYRIYDYGRPRELHLEHGCAVSDLGPYIHKIDRKQIEAGRSVLVESNYFHIERLHHNVDRIVLGGDLPHYALLIPVAGNGHISGEPFARGQVWFVPAGSPCVELVSGDGEWLLSYPGGNKPLPITFV